MSYIRILILGRYSGSFVLRCAFPLLMTSLVWISSGPKVVTHQIIFVDIIISFVLLQKDAEYRYAYGGSVCHVFFSNQCLAYFLKLLFYLIFRVHWIPVLDWNEVFAKNLCFTAIFICYHIYGTYLAAWQEMIRFLVSLFPREFVCRMCILKLTAALTLFSAKASRVLTLKSEDR